MTRTARPDTAFDRGDPECLEGKLANGSYGKNISRRALLGTAERSRGIPLAGYDSTALNFALELERQCGRQTTLGI